MTPEIRAKLAAKYNMRAEDYKPCAWNPDYVQYGDYPQLNYENAAERNGNYDWDEYWWRRNFGDPIHIDNQHHLLSAKQNSSPVMFFTPFDRYRYQHYFMIIWIWPVIIGQMIMYWFQERGYLRGTNMHRRERDLFNTPWVMAETDIKTKNEWQDSWNPTQNAMRGDYYRFLGKIQGREDDRAERFGVRYTKNYTIDGWEDLDATPSYQHTY